MENTSANAPLADEELKKKLLERKWLLGQRNRMGYGLTLGAMLLFFGIAGRQLGLLLVGAVAVAVGLYFFFRFEKQRREIDETLRRVFPEGIPDKLPSSQRPQQRT